MRNVIFNSRKNYSNIFLHKTTRNLLLKIKKKLDKFKKNKKIIFSKLSNYRRLFFNKNKIRNR
jgi:hypothetical protein